MALLPLLILTPLMLASTAMELTQAVDYSVTDNAIGTAGGTRFENEIGVNDTLGILQAASSFIWQTFRQCESDRKNVQQVSLFIDANMDGVAYADNNEIHVAANYIGSYSGDLRPEIAGILYHEMTHIWQWDGNGQTPGGLIEGIADFVRLKAGYIPSHWVRPGGGDQWDQGYDITARFLDFLNGLRDGLVADLNAKMKDSYSDNFFVDLLGKTVDELWKEYKSHFGD